MNVEPRERLGESASHYMLRAWSPSLVEARARVVGLVTVVIAALIWWLW